MDGWMDGWMDNFSYMVRQLHIAFFRKLHYVLKDNVRHQFVALSVVNSKLQNVNIPLNTNV
jgi:hypothetical protein